MSARTCILASHDAPDIEAAARVADRMLRAAGLVPFCRGSMPMARVRPGILLGSHWRPCDGLTFRLHIGPLRDEGYDTVASALAELDAWDPATLSALVAPGANDGIAARGQTEPSGASEPSAACVRSVWSTAASGPGVPCRRPTGPPARRPRFTMTS